MASSRPLRLERVYELHETATVLRAGVAVSRGAGLRFALAAASTLTIKARSRNFAPFCKASLH